MTQITVSLGPDELDDLQANSAAAAKGVEFDQIVADRLRGMAKERTRKKVALVSMKIGAGAAAATYNELPDAVFPMDGRAGVLKSSLNTVGAETPFQVNIGGAIIPTGNAKLVFDDGILTLVLPYEEPNDAAAVEGSEALPPSPVSAPSRRRIERENDAGWTVRDDTPAHLRGTLVR